MMKKNLAYTLQAGGLIAFFYYLYRYALAVPELDDYFTLIGFANSFLASHDLTEQVKLLYEQIAEHRIVLNRLVNLTILLFTGTIQLNWLIYIGNAIFVGLLVIFYVSFQEKQHKLLYFLPITYLLLQQQYNEITLSATASLQHNVVLVFVFLSFYFLSKSTTLMLILAILAALCATFTSANGIFTFLIGFSCLLLQKRWHATAVWGFSTFLTIFIYFFDYQHYGSLKISNLWEKPLSILMYSLHFIGASFHLSKLGHVLALFTGAGILLWIIFLFLKRYYIKNVFLSCVCLFLLFTTGLISIGRFELGFPYRYNIYSAIFLIISYLYWLEYSSAKWKKRLIPFFIVFSIAFSGFSYYDYTAFAEMVRREKVANIFNLTYQKESLINYFYNGFIVKATPKNQEMVLNAMRQHIYQLPPHLITDLYAKLDTPQPDVTTHFEVGHTEVKIMGDKVQISNQGLQIGNQTEDAVYIVAKSSNKIYLLMTFLEKNSLFTYLKTGFYYQEGFQTQVSKSIFDKESYNLGIVCIKNKQLFFRWIEASIDSK